MHLGLIRRGLLATGVVSTRLPLPLQKFKMMISLEEVSTQRDSQGLDATNATELAASLKAWKDQIEPIRTLCRSLDRMTSVVVDQREKMDKSVVRLEQQKQKAAAKAAGILTGSRGSQAASPQGKNGAQSAAGTGIFALDLTSTQPIAELEASANDKPIDRPWVVNDYSEGQHLAHGSPTRLNMLVFRAAFVKDKSRRDHKVMLNAGTVYDTLFAGTKWNAQSCLSSDVDPCLREVHVFGYSAGMVNMGPDVHSCGSLRMTMEKSPDRLVIACPFFQLQDAVTNAMGLSKKASMNHIKMHLRELTQERFSSMLNGGLKCYHGIIGENSLVFMPVGWFVMEKALTGAVYGLHIPIVPCSNDGIKNMNAIMALTAGMTFGGAAQVEVDLVRKISVSLERLTPPLPPPSMPPTAGDVADTPTLHDENKAKPTTEGDEEKVEEQREEDEEEEEPKTGDDVMDPVKEVAGAGMETPTVEAPATPPPVAVAKQQGTPPASSSPQPPPPPPTIQMGTQAKSSMAKAPQASLTMSKAQAMKTQATSDEKAAAPVIPKREPVVVPPPSKKARTG